MTRPFMVGFDSTHHPGFAMGLIHAYTTASPHIKLALVIAPLLAVGGYIVAEHALPRKSATIDTTPRPLKIADDCRPLNTVCKLLHRELAVNITATPLKGETRVDLATSVAIDGGVIAFAGESPVKMEARNGPRGWKALLPRSVQSGDTLRLVLVNGQRRYFAEIPMEP